MRHLFSLLILSLLAGCATETGDWGSRSTLSPGWEITRRAALDAARDPHTWVPMVGAALFSIGDFDEETSEWAVEQTPLFGNPDDADSSSDALRNLARINYYVTAIATPSGASNSWWIDKARGIGLGLAAQSLSAVTTTAMKDLSSRPRPDYSSRQEEDSFPSGHASSAAIKVRLAARNIERMDLGHRQKRLWEFAGYSVAGLTGWARVEAGWHYPSDVLAGYALGNFLGAFLNDAFIDPRGEGNAAVAIAAGPLGEPQLEFRYRW